MNIPTEYVHKEMQNFTPKPTVLAAQAEANSAAPAPTAASASARK